MDVLKFVIFFVSLACLTFGKFIEHNTHDAPETLEAETADDESLTNHQSFQDYLSVFLGQPRADPSRYRNLCASKARKRMSKELLNEVGDAKIHPDFVIERSCVSESKACNEDSENSCRTETQVQQFHVQRGSDGRWRKRMVRVNVGCGCMVRIGRK